MIDLWGGVGLDTSVGRLDMILIISNHAMQNVAEEGVLWSKRRALMGSPGAPGVLFTVPWNW